MFQINQTWISSDCKKNCTCTESGPSCWASACDPHASCDNGVCACNEKAGYFGNGCKCILFAFKKLLFKNLIGLDQKSILQAKNYIHIPTKLFK